MSSFSKYNLDSKFYSIKIEYPIGGKDKRLIKKYSVEQYDVNGLKISSCGEYIEITLSKDPSTLITSIRIDLWDNLTLPHNNHIPIFKTLDDVYSYIVKEKIIELKECIAILDHTIKKVEALEKELK